MINEALSSSETSPHDVTSQKTPFFIATAVKNSNLEYEDSLMGHGVKRGRRVRL
jgi:hypothetical protein